LNQFLGLAHFLAVWLVPVRGRGVRFGSAQVGSARVSVPGLVWGALVWWFGGLAKQTEIFEDHAPILIKISSFFFRPIQPRASGEGGLLLVRCFPGEGKRGCCLDHAPVPCSFQSSFLSQPRGGGAEKRKGLLASLGREEGWGGWLFSVLWLGWVGSGRGGMCRGRGKFPKEQIG
jgi:hypothetical protein